MAKWLRAAVLLSLLQTTAAIAISAPTNEPAGVNRLLVLFQHHAISNDSLTEDAADALRATLGQVFDVEPHPASGGHSITLKEALSVEGAKRLLQQLRLRRNIVWAEIDPANFEEHHDRLMPKRLKVIADVRQLMVVFADAETQRASDANESPRPEWSVVASHGAGMALRVVRPAVGGAWIVELPRVMTYAEAAEVGAALTASGVARFADPDAPAQSALVPNDPAFMGAPLWSLFDALSLTTPFWGVDAPSAWDLTTGDPSLVIAVVDTGVRPHAELATRLLQGYNFVHDSRSPSGPNGADPGNWRTAGQCPGRSAANSSWHGTHVAGTIAATGNNGVGISGLNWRSRILPVRVLGPCGGTTSEILTGMLWSAGLPVPGTPLNTNPARVINMSLGGRGVCTPQYQTLVNQVLARGSLVVAAAGNDEDVADYYVPASCLGLSTVGATGPYGDRAPYSNFSFGMDISAPGGDQSLGTDAGIWSTSNTGTTSPASDNYLSRQGTSMAAPHVAGVASLMLSANPSLTPAELKAIMAITATPFPSTSVCNFAICGAGIVHAGLAVAFARIIGSGPPTVQVVEYFHAGFGHYFVTADSTEIAALDGGAFGGVWQRTGQTFRAYAGAAAGAVPVCRFFSTSFAPKASHFYTPFASECSTVKENPNWTYEGTTFHIAVPNASGICPANTTPVYRMYNNGQSGAPNHRFTSDPLTRAQFTTSRGWISEGFGSLGVGFCAAS